MHSTWAEAQAAFAAAVTDARLPPPPNVIECGEHGPHRGFAVYRNNSMVGLIDALQARFPVTCRLVGEEFFRAMARSYVTEHRPRSPLLMSYGDDFPGFIDGFSPADGVPYLSDVARLEVAWSEAYYAPDAPPLELQALPDIRSAALIDMRLILHPSLRILRSGYPIVDIWAAHQSSGEITPPANWQPQDVLIVRPDADVLVCSVSCGLYGFVTALLERQRVQDAAALALADEPDFNIGESLVRLFRMGVIVAFDTEDAQEMQT